MSLINITHLQFQKLAGLHYLGPSRFLKEEYYCYQNYFNYYDSYCYLILCFPKHQIRITITFFGCVEIGGHFVVTVRHTKSCSSIEPSLLQ